MQQLIEKALAGWVSATHAEFAGNEIAGIIRGTLKVAVQENVPDNYTVKGSAGNGRWADVPWVSVLDPEITKTTQDGIYPVYLFRADGTGLYLSLGFGTSKFKDELGAVKARERIQLIASNVQQMYPEILEWAEDSPIDLRSSTSLGKSYEWASAGAKFYSAGQVPNDDQLFKDLKLLLDIYERLPRNIMQSDAHILKKNSNTSTRRIPKPFMLFAGISGTGKTRFVREQSKKTGDLSVTYQLTAVRPDWHEPGDLLGYRTRLSGKAEYVVTDILRFICRAWAAIADSGVVIKSGVVSGSSTVCSVVGEEAQLRGIVPFWLCLDEMNLAPVEQYFADYLSILETREWQWEDSLFTYLCDPLLSSSSIVDLAQSEQDGFRATVGLGDPTYDLLWSCFCKHGIGIPFNLIVAGTVNMDETTHGFSRKVLDRALTIDFDEFFPNDFSTFFKQTKKPVTFTYPVLSRPSQDKLPDIDADGGKSIAFLEEINRVLDGTPFKVAYRAVNELLLMITCFKPSTELELKAVWDDFLMLKVLSRIEGDIDKLGQAHSDNTVLKELLEILEVEFSPFWNNEAGMDGARPDLFQISSAGEVVTADCRSKAKITWMQSRLESSGFTSFWP